MPTGCYIIGENAIHLSTDIVPIKCSGSKDHILLFKEACKKLENKKLECLVLVDGLRNNSIEEIQEIYGIAKGYANLVYVITPIVALLQNAISSLIKESDLSESNNTVIVFIAASFGIQAFILEKINNRFYCVEIKGINSLNIKESFPYLLLNPAFCLYDATLHHGILNDLCAAFPNLFKKSFANPMEALSYGGLCKSLCIVEPGKHFEIINFTPGIFVGQEIIVEPCTVFPVTVHYSTPLVLLHDIRYCQTIRTMTLKIDNREWNVLKLKDKILYRQISLMNYIINYNEFGVLTIEKSSENPIPLLNCGFIFTEKFAIWFAATQIFAVYNFQQNSLEISKIYYKFQNPKNNDEFQKLEEFVKNIAANFKALTIIYDEKFEYRINQSNIFVIPSYIALMECCIRHFRPIKDKLIIFVTTKTTSKFYVLSSTSFTAYTVVYIGSLKSSQTIIDRNFFRGQNNLAIFHLTDENPMMNLLFTKKITVYGLSISDWDTVFLHGSLMHSTMESQPLRIIPHVNFGYSNNPVNTENIILNTIIPSKYFEIEAIFYEILPEIADSKLFWGDLIAVLIPKSDTFYTYIFGEVDAKYLLQHYFTINIKAKIIPHLLKKPSKIIIFKNEQFSKLKLDKKLKPTFVNENSLKNAAANFLKAVQKEYTNIYRTVDYCNAVKVAVRNGLFDKIIYQKEHSMIIECDGKRCRILLEEEDMCLTCPGDEQWIPMTISFLQKSPNCGKKALQDLPKYPEYVLYDFIDFLEATVTKHPLINPEWKFEVVELDNSKNPKLGFKIKTPRGYRIVTAEMALAIFLQSLVLMYEKFSKSEITKIYFHSIKIWFTRIQRNCIEKTVANLLKRDILYKKF